MVSTNLVTFLARLISCTDATPTVDENGCWTDPAEALEAVRVADCPDTYAECFGHATPCDDYYDGWRESDSPPICWNGCEVDRCLHAIAQASESCDAVDYREVCFGDDGPFAEWMANPECERVSW